MVNTLQATITSVICQQQQPASNAVSNSLVKRRRNSLLKSNDYYSRH